MKTELTQDDKNRLDAARGLTLEANGPGVVRPYNNGTGRKPSVLTYNTAVKKGIYLGSPIIPIDEIWYRKPKNAVAEVIAGAALLGAVK